MKKQNILILIVLLAILFGGLILVKTFASDLICWPACSSSEPVAGLPNPASVNCEEVGGTLDIRTDTSGGQVGYCLFSDGSECEEWALLRNECSLGGSEPVVCTKEAKICPDGSAVGRVGPDCEFTSCLKLEDNFRGLNIKAGDNITSPLKITGEVRGNWSFEASFPIILTNWDGLIIAEVPARLLGDWMTTDFVPFEAELKFTKPANPTNQDYASKGSLILKKDNPSGLPEHDAAYELPIRF
ncbi:MAG TPA: DUF333 domain-containing protein [Candidatus Paceibacterota bacterium]|nr:DUF333 domain-containing protein [Candidatus Paceibacterota bacterium]